MYIRTKMSDTESLYSAASELTRYIERSDDTGYLSTEVVQALVIEINAELNNLIEMKRDNYEI